MKKKTSQTALAIDPGNEGAFLVSDGATFLKSWPMPIVMEGKEKRIDFHGVVAILQEVNDEFGQLPVFLERAVSFGMGMKQAFNYGRGFESLVIALSTYEGGWSVTYVEPSKWAKEMHQGISNDMKAKAKSLVAVRRLFPKLVRMLPTKPRGGLMDGPVDALMILGYGLRQLRPKGMHPVLGEAVPWKRTPEQDDRDFY